MIGRGLHMDNLARKQLLSVLLLGGLLGPILGFSALAYGIIGAIGDGGREGMAAAIASVLLVIYEALWFPWGFITTWLSGPDNMFVFALVFIADGATWCAVLWMLARGIRRLMKRTNKRA